MRILDVSAFGFLPSDLSGGEADAVSYIESTAPRFFRGVSDHWRQIAPTKGYEVPIDTHDTWASCYHGSLPARVNR
jgi:hypothetical protein